MVAGCDWWILIRSVDNLILETFPRFVFESRVWTKTVVITKILTLGYHIRIQTNERSVWKEAVVLRRMGNPGETLKFGIKRVDKGQICLLYTSPSPRDA